MDGMRRIKTALCLYSSLCWPLFGDRLCPCCGKQIEAESTYIATCDQVTASIIR